MIYVPEVPGMHTKCLSMSTKVSNTRTDNMGVETLKNTVSLIWDNAVSERTLSTYSAWVKEFQNFLNDE